MDDDAIIIQPEDGTAYRGRWRIRIIRAGLSGNGNFYSDQALMEAASLFNGARVFVKGDQEHLKGLGKDVRNLIGRLSETAFVAGNGPDAGELQGTLDLIEPDGVIGRKIKAAWDRGMTDLFGFSIDAMCVSVKGAIEGKPVRILRRVQKVNSLDLIVEPGAGGQVLNLIESKGSKSMDEDEFLTGADVRRIVEATRLPQPAKTKLIAHHNVTEDLTEAQLREAISTEADYLASVSDSGKVTGLGDGAGDRRDVRLIEGRGDKVQKMLDAFFDPADRSVRSIREVYLSVTGDRNFTGLYRNCDQGRMTEALDSGSFTEVLGDSIARRILKEYANETIYDVWRKLANVVPVADFREQQRTRFGGYGDLPVVDESDPYLALSSPTDEKAVYAIAKRGGTESLTLEMITNDDVGAVQRIPRNLVRAAKRTLSKFVLDFLRTNPVIYDDIAFFHGDHGNLGSTALGTGSLAAGRLAIKNQVEMDSGEKIGLGPRNLWVPDTLEETAVDLFRRNTEQDHNFIQSLSLDVIPVWYWTDSNDWCLTTDVNDLPPVEVGFLSGQEEPELFVQDHPSLGSMFSNDQVTYKIRHIYGGAVTDYRGAYKAVVT
ncbi:MAG: hypothetical protein WD767_14360 [Alphaproteobacteria bacterium]